MDNLTLAPKLALHEQVKAAKKAGQNAKAFKQAQEQALEQNAKSLRAGGSGRQSRRLSLPA